MDYTLPCKYLRPTAGGPARPFLLCSNPRPTSPSRASQPAPIPSKSFAINTSTKTLRQPLQNQHMHNCIKTNDLHPSWNQHLQHPVPATPPKSSLTRFRQRTWPLSDRRGVAFLFLLSSHVHDRILAGPEGFGPSERARTRFTGLKVRRIRPLCHGPTLLSGDCVYHKKEI
jgi:hypothetical protein